jgi:DNA-binding CsgD family transcriptional regulator
MTEGVLRTRAEGRLRFLRRLGLDAILLDLECRPLAPVGNDAPEAVLRLFVVQDGRLMLRSAGARARFAAGIGSLSHEVIGTKVLLPLGADHLLMLMHDAVGETPVILVILVDRHLDDRVCPRCLRSAFDLTAREADLTVLLARGQPVQAASSVLGISIATARTHLRHVFQKTGSRTQAELVALIAACALGPCPPQAAACGCLPAK